MRRLAILARVLMIVLVTLTLFLVYRFLLEENTELEGVPSLATDIELLVAVVAMILFSFWIAFRDEEMKGWEKRLLLIVMFFGSLLFLYLSFACFFDWGNSQAAINAANLLVAAGWMLIIAVILLAAIPGFILIFRHESAVSSTKKTSS